MKRIWRGVLVALLVVLGAFMLWPRNLGEAFDAEKQFAVSITIFDVVNGRPDNHTEQYDLPAGTEAGARINDLLSRHTYHLTLSSLMGDSVIDGANITMHFVNSDGVFLTLTGGTTELFLNQRTYRLDYWGRDRGTELCEAVLAILREGGGL